MTDNGNFVIDSPWDESYMLNPADLLHRIKMLTGVLEVGLFCQMASAAFFGEEDGTVLIKYATGKTHRVESVPGVDDGEEAK